MEWLPYALSIGVTEERFWHLNPHKLKPYIEAETIRSEKRDKELWLLGLYVHRATLSSTEKVLAGSKSKIEYYDKPLLAQAKEEVDISETQELSKAEQKRQAELYFASLDVMATNARLRKHREEKGS